MELKNNFEELRIHVIEPTSEPDLSVSKVESAASPDSEPAVTSSEKLKRMHKDIQKILQKVRTTSNHLKVLRQEAENSYESQKNNLEPSVEEKISDLSDISIQNSNTLWEELKSTEAQISLLKGKICSSEQALIFKRKRNQKSSS